MDDWIDGTAAGLAHHPGFEHGGRPVDPVVHRDGRSVVEDDYRPRLDRGHGLDERHLLGREVEVVPVGAFHLLPPGERHEEQRDFGGACGRDRLVDEIGAARVVGRVALRVRDRRAAR
jgi:hypothetical protein